MFSRLNQGIFLFSISLMDLVLVFTPNYCFDMINDNIDT